MDAKINKQLVSAVENGNLERLRNLLSQYGLEKSEGYGYVLLRTSIFNRYTEITKLLLSHGSRVNSRKNKEVPSDTPLHYAVQNGNIEVINMLLDHNANINAKNNSAWATPLLWAIRRDSEEIVELLLERGAFLHDCSPVYGAVRIGSYKMTEKLIQHGACVNSTSDSSKEYPLHCAAQLYNGCPIAELLLKHGANVNLKTMNGMTALHLSSQHGHTETIKLLLSANADVNAVSNDLFTPLYLAVNKSYREAAKCLMDHGANINTESKNGETVLSLAVSKDLLMIVEDILKYSPDVNNTVNKNCLKIAAKKRSLTIVINLLNYGFPFDNFDFDDLNFLMEEAIKGGTIEIIQHIIKHGCHLDCFKKKNCNFLHIAAKSKEVEIAKLLLDQGTDVNALDAAGKCAIYYATEQSNVIMIKLFLSHGASVQNSPELIRIATKNLCKEIVEILLQNKVDIEATDRYGMTALHLTAMSEYSELFGLHMKEDESQIKSKGEIAKLLLSMGANVNAITNEDKLTPLHIACKKGFKNVVEVLLEYKADVNLVAKDCSPLMIAAQGGHDKIMEMLIANGANVNLKRENGNTALHIAARRDGNMNALEVLLKNGADVNSKNIIGATALHVAVKASNLENISILLQHGCPINSKDIEGNTPLHVAVTVPEKTQVLELLLDSGSDINILNNNNLTAVENYLDSRMHLRTITPPLYDSDDDYDNGYNVYSPNALQKHLIKLLTANLYLIENNLRYIHEHNDPYTILYKQICKEEIEELKISKIAYAKISFYDILTKNIHVLANYTRNADIIQIFESDQYKLKFPIYAPIIKRNFEKAYQRRLILEQAHKFLKCYFSLPYECSDHIAGYLSYDDLKNIINVSNTTTTVKDF